MALFRTTRVVGAFLKLRSAAGACIETDQADRIDTAGRPGSIRNGRGRLRSGCVFGGNRTRCGPRGARASLGASSGTLAFAGLPRIGPEVTSQDSPQVTVLLSCERDTRSHTIIDTLSAAPAPPILLFSGIDPAGPKRPDEPQALYIESEAALCCNAAIFLTRRATSAPGTLKSYFGAVDVCALAPIYKAGNEQLCASAAPVAGTGGDPL